MLKKMTGLGENGEMAEQHQAHTLNGWPLI